MSVTSVSGNSANGMTVSVANPTTTPQITVGTSVSGVLKGNGTAIAAGVSGTDYLAPGQARARFTPESFGAAGNGTTDDSTALNNCFAAAAGADVYLNPAKTYMHKSVLTVGQNGTRILGGGTLLATIQTTSAVHVTGNYCSIEGVTLSFSQAGATRQSVNQAQKLWVEGSNFTAANVYINGSAAAGVFMYGAAYFVLTNVYVYGTLADGIHCTHGSHDGRIIGCTGDTTGDDSFAVVSYASDGTSVKNIVNIGSYSYTSSARGFSVVGGTNIRYYDGYVVNSADAAIYIAAESSFNTLGVSRAIVDGFDIAGANTAAATSPQAGVLITNQQPSGTVITDVTVRNITLTNTNTGAASQFAIYMNSGANNVVNIVIDAVQIVGTGPSQILGLSNIARSVYQVPQSFLTKRLYLTSAATADPGIDQVLLLGAGAALTLPPAAANCRRYSVRNVYSTSLSISPTGSDQINSAGSYTIAAGANTDFISDQSSNWYSYP